MLSVRKNFKLLPIHEKCIKILYEELENSPSLYLLHATVPLLVCTDASAFGGGAPFLQIINNQVYPIKFYSFKFNPSHMKMHSTAKELLTILQVYNRNEFLFKLQTRSVIVTDLRLLTYVLCHAEASPNTVISYNDTHLDFLHSR